MNSITVHLDDDTRAFVDRIVASGEYESAADYFLGLIETDRIGCEKDKLEALLREGLQSEATPMTEAEWEELRQNVDAKQVSGTQP